MPELPDVESFRRYFDKHALNKKIIGVTVKHPRIIRGTDENSIKNALVGKKFISTKRHGKYLFAEIEQGEWMLMHFGMTGYLVWFEDTSDDPPLDRFLINFEKGNLAYVSQRMLGKIGVVSSPDTYAIENRLGEDAMGISRERFAEIFGGKTGQVKTLLMDQSLVAGVGNEYSDEILFQAGIHPSSRLEKREDWIKIYDIMNEVLCTAIKANADSVKFPDSYLLKTRRKGEKCPVCGGTIEAVKIGGRTGYFCTGHQRKSE